VIAMIENQEQIQRIVDVLTQASRNFGLMDYMPEAKIGLYARQSVPGAYEDGVFRSDQFYHWVRQEHPVPDHVFSRVFAKLREGMSDSGVEVKLPDGFDPSFDEVIQEYLRYDHNAEAAGSQAMLDQSEPTLQTAMERDLRERVIGAPPEEIEIEVDSRELEEGPADPADEAPPVAADEAPPIAATVALEAQDMTALRAEVRAELLAGMRAEVEDEVRAMLAQELREEVKSELVSLLRPLMIEHMAKEYDPDELLQVMGTVEGEGAQEPHTVDLSEPEPDPMQEPHEVAFTAAGGPGEAETPSAPVAAGTGCSSPPAAPESESRPPLLSAEEQLALIRSIREKLGPQLREQLMADLAALARAQAERTRQQESERRLQDPDYCLARLRDYLFADQPALWDKIKPIIKIDDWRPVVRLLSEDPPELDRQRLDGSRPVLRETLRLKADIEEELAGMSEGPASPGQPGIKTMLAGADQVLTFTLTNIAQILEAGDPRPKS
jgi:hypothetical protein